MQFIISTPSHEQATQNNNKKNTLYRNNREDVDELLDEVVAPPLISTGRLDFNLKDSNNMLQTPCFSSHHNESEGRLVM